MKNLVLIINIILAYSFFFACNSPNCDNIGSWINEAPLALEEYIKVEKEIKNDTVFYIKFSIRGSLFLNPRDTNEYFKFNLPNLKAWFRKHRDYISIDTNCTSVCYKKCISINKMTTSGLIYHYYENRVGNYKPIVNIIDSLNLKDNWLAHVISCSKCDD